MTSILDHHSPTTDQVFKSSIAMSTHPPTPTIEPLPHLDYFLLNQLINLVHPHLTKHQLKRIEYMVDARRSFYEGHEKFQIAYRDLLDAHACAEMLDGEVQRLSCLLEDTTTTATTAAAGNDDGGVAALQKRLCAIEIQRQSNEEDMRVRLEHLQTRTKLRSHISLWYSDLKVVFVRDEMPWLVELAKQKCGGAIEREAAQQIIGPSSVLSLNVWMVGEGGNSDHCSDSGGSSTPEVEMRDSGFGMGVDEGEDVGIL